MFSIAAETREITQHPDESCKKAKYATRANRVECEPCNCVLGYTLYYQQNMGALVVLADHAKWLNMQTTINGKNGSSETVAIYWPDEKRQ